MEQQMRLLEDPPPAGAVPVWTTLDEEQRAAIVKKLAQVLANAIAEPREEEHHE
jgi:hypothetical protein